MLQDVVTSIHFVKIKTVSFAKLPGFNSRSAGPSLVYSLLLCSLSYWSVRLSSIPCEID